MQLQNNFKNNLIAIRKSVGITQTELANKINVNQRTISAWEKGVCEPSISLLLELCDYFDESLDSLILN